MTVEIPDKSYFKIGEVSRILGVEPYNIRYWESQFRVVKPAKTKSRQRLYRRTDIRLLLRIKQLLYEEGYTIAGAKKRLKSVIDGTERDEHDPPVQPSLLTDQEREAYDERLSKSQAELQALQAEASKLHEELQQLRAEHRAQLDLYDADRLALVEELKASRSAASTSNDDEALRRHISALEASKAELERQLAQAPAELSATKARLAAQAERASSLERDVSQLRRQQKLMAEAIRGELRPLIVTETET